MMIQYILYNNNNIPFSFLFFYFHANILHTAAKTVVCCYEKSPKPKRRQRSHFEWQTIAMDAIISSLGFDPTDIHVKRAFRNFIVGCIIFIIILAPNWLFAPR
jgi:hypothetical protein